MGFLAMAGHLLLETMLVVVIVFLLFQKSYTPDTPSLSEAVSDLQFHPYPSISAVYR